MDLGTLFSSSVVSRLDSGLRVRSAEILARETPEGSVSAAALSELTKYVEVRLRERCERHNGSKLARESRYGVRLLDAVRESGLFDDEDGNSEPLYFLGRWFFSERNGPHHGDQPFALSDAAAVLLVGDFLIRHVDGPRPPMRHFAIAVTVAPVGAKAGDELLLRMSSSLPTGTSIDDFAAAQGVFFVTQGAFNWEVQGVPAGPGIWEAKFQTGDLEEGTVSVKAVVDMGGFRLSGRQSQKFQLGHI